MKNINCIKSCVVVLTLFTIGCATNGGGQNLMDSAEQSAQSGSQITQSGAAAAQGVGASQMSLTDTLTRQLGISQNQALGGSGAIFKAAQGNMSPQDFTTLSQSVPEMNDMLSAAPEPDPISSMTGGVSSMMGGSDTNLTSTASLASSFQQLNLSPDMVGKFMPIVTDYIQNTGGQAAAGLLQSALPFP
jgi:Protein of unknown function VcgC/VcgE (DUF2780)